jgi:hypothetical protein
MWLHLEGTRRSSTESVMACPDRDVPAARKVMGAPKRFTSPSAFTTCAER